jgi:hypothetical protein
MILIICIIGYLVIVAGILYTHLLITGRNKKAPFIAILPCRDTPCIDRDCLTCRDNPLNKNGENEKKT